MQTKKKIILVNIKGTALGSLSDLLEMWGYIPIKIESAETITTVLFGGSPALIIYQFLEFSEDEYELLTSIRDRAPGLPVLATSPFISVRDTFRIARSGVADYLVQPYMPAYLKKVIENCLGATLAAQREDNEAEKLELAMP